MKKILIGIVGKAGAGKDTIADYLVEKYSFEKIALADPLKAALAHMFLLDLDNFYDQTKKTQPLQDFPDWTPRKLMQFIGTELIRKQFDQSFWAKILLKNIKQNDTCNKFVVPDVRFPDEMESLKTKKGRNTTVLFVEVVRPGCKGTNVGIQNHESEIHDLKADFTVKNDGSFADLERKIDRIMRKNGLRKS